MDLKVDYHIHTSYSDGALTPTQIVKKFKEEEYDIIAVTDHDGVDGIREAKIAGEAIELKVIQGVELSSVTEKGVNIHILGYNMDVDNNEFIETLNELKEWRKDRNLVLVNKLDGLGYHVDIDEIYKAKGNHYIGKPDIARYLIDKGMINKMDEAFNTKTGIYSNEEIKNIKRKKIKSKKAINILKNAKGTPVLAHPMKIESIGEKGSEEFFANLNSLIRSLKVEGLKGLECYHPSANEEDSKKLVEMAEKYHLHITEGSDFHS
ncbi:MAG: PHP domain-containing protein [Peptostreptococcaceae bacterium]|nr:PHP domain-containing protein [Peptostreptococcaceae bacterium]